MKMWTFFFYEIIILAPGHRNSLVWGTPRASRSRDTARCSPVTAGEGGDARAERMRSWSDGEGGQSRVSSA